MYACVRGVRCPAWAGLAPSLGRGCPRLVVLNVAVVGVVCAVADAPAVVGHHDAAAMRAVCVCVGGGTGPGGWRQHQQQLHCIGHVSGRYPRLYPPPPTHTHVRFTPPTDACTTSTSPLPLVRKKQSQHGGATDAPPAVDNVAQEVVQLLIGAKGLVATAGWCGGPCAVDAGAGGGSAPALRARAPPLRCLATVQARGGLPGSPHQSWPTTNSAQNIVPCANQ